MSIISPDDLVIPFDPITGPISETNVIIDIFGGYFLFYFGAMLVTMLGVDLYKRIVRDDSVHFEQIGDSGPQNIGDTLKTVMAGPMEEMGFRGLAVIIAFQYNLNIVITLLVVNMIWAAFHTRDVKAYFYTFTLGLYLSRFWYFGFEGLWWVAVIMHSLHNSIVIFFSRSP